MKKRERSAIAVVAMQISWISVTEVIDGISRQTKRGMWQVKLIQSSEVTESSQYVCLVSNG